MVSNGDPAALRQLSNTVNVSLAKAANRPLQSLSLNAKQVGHPLSPGYCLGVHVTALRLFPVLCCAVKNMLQFGASQAPFITALMAAHTFSLNATQVGLLLSFVKYDSGLVEG